MLPNTLYYKCDNEAIIPKRATPGSAGFDLYTPQNVRIEGRGKTLVDLKLQILLPENTYGRIAPRSSLSWKYFLDVGAGVIDSDYQGSIKVLLYNFSEESVVLKRGTAIAQLICERILIPDLIEHVGPIMNPTFRGAGGFGSTDQ